MLEVVLGLWKIKIGIYDEQAAVVGTIVRNTARSGTAPYIQGNGQPLPLHVVREVSVTW